MEQSENLTALCKEALKLCKTVTLHHNSIINALARNGVSTIEEFKQTSVDCIKRFRTIGSAKMKVIYKMRELLSLGNPEEANKPESQPENPGDLTKREIEVILKIAKRVGKDRDGDILHFYVQEDQNIATVLSPLGPVYHRGKLEPSEKAINMLNWPKEGYPVEKVEERDGGIAFTIDTTPK